MLQTGRHGAPVLAVLNAEVAEVATEQFIGSLANEYDFDVLARALTDVIHRDNRGGGNRLLQDSGDLRERFFKIFLRDLNRKMRRVEVPGSKGGVLEFVVAVLGEAITDGEC